jgi:hypothetical protein
MKTSRKKIIQNKIFTKGNIKSLWSKIKPEYENSQRENNYSSLGMQINCDD